MYIPPKYTLQQVGALCDYISDSIEKVKRDLGDPYICIGGDMNNKEIASAFRDFEDLKELPNVPSRFGASLDVCFTNFGNEIFEVASHPLLQNTGGAMSDHLVLSYRFAMERRHHFQVVTRKVRRFDEASLIKFRSLVCSNDWSDMDGRSPTEMVERLDGILGSYYDLCFPKTTIKLRSTDLPWVSKRIKRAIRRRKRKYRSQGYSAEWRDTQKEVTAKISENKVRHLDKVKKKILEGGSSKGYYDALKLLREDKPRSRWTTGDIFPGQEDEVVAEKCAEFFNAISKEFTQIQQPVPVPTTERLAPPEIYQIAGRLKCIKKSKTQVPGDLDPRVVTFCCDGLAVALHKIFGAVYDTCQWPEKWKDETVTIIPKNNSPSSLSETRNISCTLLFSKQLESFLLEGLRRDVKLQSTQFGGIKGLGVDHFLVETWDEILRAVDRGGLAINLMSIDFQKAFNTMDHSTCLERLRVKGAHPHLIRLTAAFLYNRTMSVKHGSARSAKKTVSGGASQGSIVGPFLFCVATEILAEAVVNTDLSRRLLHQPQEAHPDPDVSLPLSDDSDFTSSPGTSDAEWAEVEAEFNFFRARRRNPLDDTVVSLAPEREDEEFEEVPMPSVKAYIDDFNIIEVIPISSGARHITTTTTRVRLFAGKSQKIFENVSLEAGVMKMVVNEKKTQMICIDSNPGSITTSFIQPSGSQINSGDSLKILGFIFGPRPTCRLQIDSLISKYRMRLWSLRKFSAYGLSRPDLLGFYTVFMRPVLEYTQVTYHSMITREQSGLLERSQARALKIIYRTDPSYAASLEVSGLTRL